MPIAASSRAEPPKMIISTMLKFWRAVDFATTSSLDQAAERAIRSLGAIRSGWLN